MTSFGSGRIRRRAAAAGFTGVAGLMAVASTAWACTIVMGITKISNPTNGTYTTIDREGQATGPGVKGFRGDVLKVMAWELKPNAKYALWFVWPASVTGGMGCHTVDNTTGAIMMNPAGTALKKMKTDGAGQFDKDPYTAGAQPYKAVIPNDPQATSGGTAEICGREVYPVAEGPNTSATQHVKLTIL